MSNIYEQDIASKRDNLAMQDKQLNKVDQLSKGWEIAHDGDKIYPKFCTFDVLGGTMLSN
jgi:hypothetical protein